MLPRPDTSPALFNRCVVDWFGTWSTSALAHVGDALLADVDVEQLGAWSDEGLSVVQRADRDALLQKASFSGTMESDSDEEEEQPTTLKTALVAALVEVHTESEGTARDFVDCCRRFAKDVVARREALEQRQQRSRPVSGNWRPRPVTSRRARKFWMKRMPNY